MRDLALLRCMQGLEETQALVQQGGPPPLRIREISVFLRWALSQSCGWTTTLSSIHFLPCFLSLLKLIVLRPLRTSAFARSA